MTLVMQRRLVWATVALSLLVVSALVVRLSAAAFVATTDNANNSWQTGEVTLTDDDSGSAMFSATGLVPGQTVENCIVVTYGGSVDAGVRLYGADLTQTNALADDLDLTVDAGSGGGFGDCTGFTSSANLVTSTALSTFAATYTNFTNGLDTWAPTGGSNATRTYRFRVTLNASSTAEAATAGYRFVWEAQNS